jgi:hypothetical protein
MVNWLKSWTVDRLIIVSTTITVLAEVVINFITSYQHIYDLGLKFGEYGVDARLMPVGIDLMLLAFAEVNLFLSRRGRKSRWMRIGLALGVLGTVLANGAYGANWGATGGMLAFWSPLALFATVEAGMLLLRVAAEDREKVASTALSAPRMAIPGEDFPPITEAAIQEALRRLAEIRQNEPASVPGPGEGEIDSPELEGKDSAPALHLESWRGLNGARVQ